MPEAAEKRECDSVPETAVFSTSISSRSVSKPSCGGRVPFNPLIAFQLIFFISLFHLHVMNRNHPGGDRDTSEIIPVAIGILLPPLLTASER